MYAHARFENDSNRFRTIRERWTICSRGFCRSGLPCELYVRLITYIACANILKCVKLTVEPKYDRKCSHPAIIINIGAWGERWKLSYEIIKKISESWHGYSTFFLFDENLWILHVIMLLLISNHDIENLTINRSESFYRISSPKTQLCVVQHPQLQLTKQNRDTMIPESSYNYFNQTQRSMILYILRVWSFGGCEKKKLLTLRGKTGWGVMVDHSRPARMHDLRTRWLNQISIVTHWGDDPVVDFVRPSCQVN